jgi:hypothetical protein
MLHHRRLNRWQQLNHRSRSNAQRFAHGNCGGHVKTDESARCHTQLTAEAPGEVPNLPAF